jgi:hypothetical protein
MPMKIHFLRLAASGVTILLCSSYNLCHASDHADPMSLYVFKVQQSAEANITDLHAFVVDKEGKLVTEGDPTVTGDQLIISLCMRRSLLPQQISALNLKGYQFRVHLDVDPPVRFFDEHKTRDGKVYAEELEKLTGAARGNLVSLHESDRTMQALYGGIITQPDGIAEEGLIEFELDLVKNDAEPEQSEAIITKTRFEGIPGKVNIVTKGGNEFQPGLINVQAGIFDDPFIFPRFFRRNVVGVVTSIPLSSLPPSARHRAILLWATTHKEKGEQIDHVGRSLRTQLPRFGYLNEKHPSEHVKAITQVHDRPSVMEDILATFLSPLEAHRHYDSVPDVMVYDLRKPAKFPNGRALDDDVAATLADAGETLLLELSYAESRQSPRATTNDKQFMAQFPYLAPRWTMREIADSMQPGFTVPATDSFRGPPKTKIFEVPRAPDSAAIAFPNFKIFTWQTLKLVEVAAIVILTILLLFTVRSNITRGVVIVVALLTICLLQAVTAPNLSGPTMEAMAQPSKKACRLIFGAAVIAIFKVCWIFALGRRFGVNDREREPFPPGNQGVNKQDRPTATDSYENVKKAVFDSPYYGDKWGGPERRLLPIYKQTLGSILRGFFPHGKYFLYQAAKRTVRSRADLRWGPDRQGFRRLLHPMGICLTGTWKITGAPENKNYTGYFKSGTEARIIARYSTGGSKPWGGHYRSLALVGKIYSTKDDVTQIPTEGPAHFFAQEDLGATFTNNIREAILTNSPPVSPWNRGKDIVFLLINGLTLLAGDTKNSERQLYEIAELGKSKDTPTSCPRFMRLTVADETPKVGGDGADFREEILGIIYDRGDATPKRKLIFDIAVSDTGTKWKAVAEFLTGQEPWTKIGQIVFDEAAASYNGDFVIHFHHPPWRNDRNDPRSIARHELRPIRAKS